MALAVLMVALPNSTHKRQPTFKREFRLFIHQFFLVTIHDSGSANMNFVVLFNRKMAECLILGPFLGLNAGYLLD